MARKRRNIKSNLKITYNRDTQWYDVEVGFLPDIKASGPTVETALLDFSGSLREYMERWLFYPEEWEDR